MEELKYFQDGNSGFIIQSESNDQVAVVWTDTENDEEIKEAEKLTKIFINAPKLLEALINADNVLKMASLIDKSNICEDAQLMCEKVIKNTLT